MASRWLRFLVLGFTCLWFGMLVPVHQRGLLTLPGTAAPAKAEPTAGGHCSRSADVDSPCHKRDQKQSEGKQTPARPGSCAVCHYILGLHTPPPAVFVEARLGLLKTLPIDQAERAPVRHAALPFHGLDPPVA